MINTVKLVDIRSTETIELPSYQGSQVVVYKELLTQDQREIAQLTWDKDQFKIVLTMIVKAIKSWNFVDENEKVLEPSIENLGKLPQKDLGKIFEAVTGKTIEQLAEIGQSKVDKKKE